jgi:hypothetical protein
MKAAAQPSLPHSGPKSLSVDSDHAYITSAGAMPKLIRSDKESYCTPNSLCVPVSRATRPSRPSSTAAMKIATAASVKWPPMLAMIA